MRHRERRSQALGAPFLPERARRRGRAGPASTWLRLKRRSRTPVEPASRAPFSLSEGESPGGVSETTSETRLSARWTPSSTTPRQDVQEQQGDDGDCRGDSDDGNGGGGHDHAALISLLRTGETLSTRRNRRAGLRLTHAARGVLSRGDFRHVSRVSLRKSCEDPPRVQVPAQARGRRAERPGRPRDRRSELVGGRDVLNRPRPRVAHPRDRQRYRRRTRRAGINAVFKSSRREV
jgi:hypothetical protein